MSIRPAITLADPTACEMGGVPRLHGLLVGRTREAVADEERRLASEGLA